MTFILNGKITRIERPDKYLNKFVDFKLTERIKENGEIITKRKVLYTTSPRFAAWLNKRGNNLEWVDDPERASAMCQTQEISIDQTKFIKPWTGWALYLTRKYGSTKDEITLDGKIDVWSQTRLPLPWLYLIGGGKLVDTFVYQDNQFVSEPNAEHKGRILTLGPALDTPVLDLRLTTTRTRKSTTHIQRLGAPIHNYS